MAEIYLAAANRLFKQTEPALREPQKTGFGANFFGMDTAEADMAAARKYGGIGRGPHPCPGMKRTSPTSTGIDTAAATISPANRNGAKIKDGGGGGVTMIGGTV